MSDRILSISIILIGMGLGAIILIYSNNARIINNYGKTLALQEAKIKELQNLPERNNLQTDGYITSDISTEKQNQSETTINSDQINKYELEHCGVIYMKESEFKSGVCCQIDRYNNWEWFSKKSECNEEQNKNQNVLIYLTALNTETSCDPKYVSLVKAASDDYTKASDNMKKCDLDLSDCETLCNEIYSQTGYDQISSKYKCDINCKNRHLSCIDLASTLEKLDKLKEYMVKYCGLSDK